MCSLLYFSTVTAIKISILLMYRRLFGIIATFRRQSLVMGVVVLAFFVAGTVAALCSCHPFQRNWQGQPVQKNCLNFNIFWMVTGAIEVVIDTIILTLPMGVITKLQMPPIRKFSIIGVFLLGSLCAPLSLDPFSLIFLPLGAASNIALVSSSRVFFVLYTATCLAAGVSPSAKRGSGQPYTSVWPSFVLVCLLSARSSPPSLISLVRRPLPSGSALPACADGPPRVALIPIVMNDRGMRKRLRCYLGDTSRPPTQERAGKNHRETWNRGVVGLRRCM
jgi:hypothetical protein